MDLLRGRISLLTNDVEFGLFASFDSTNIRDLEMFRFTYSYEVFQCEHPVRFSTRALPFIMQISTQIFLVT